MKRSILLAALLLVAAGLQTVNAQKIILRFTDKSMLEYNISGLECVEFSEENVEHEWVNLGLPSGTKWATCNVGASRPEEYGDYFAWGDTEPKDTYDWNTYFDTDDGGDTFNKYNENGGLTKLLPEDDAAAVNWGGSWRMPTGAQQDELGAYCTREWTTLNGVKGILVTGPNGNTIFLPAAGYRDGTGLYDAGSCGDYWSSLLFTDFSSYAYGLYFNSSHFNADCSYRCCGRSVRPVCP